MGRRCRSLPNRGWTPRQMELCSPPSELVADGFPSVSVEDAEKVWQRLGPKAIDYWDTHIQRGSTFLSVEDVMTI